MTAVRHRDATEDGTAHDALRPNAVRALEHLTPQRAVKPPKTTLANPRRTRL